MRSSVIYFFLIFSAVKINVYQAKLARIIGGKRVFIRDYPYQASLQYVRRHHCGGAIISEMWILTAAHCVLGFDTHLFRVRVGSSSHDREGYLHKVTNAFCHTQYNSSSLDYDIAVVRVSPTMNLGTSTMKNISLATGKDRVSPGLHVVVSGWGVYDDRGFRIIPQHLRAVRVRVVEKRLCKQLLKPYPVTETMICAGQLRGGKDACSGDSGGPLIWNHILIGLVSWGDSCAQPNKSGVYSSIAYFRNWIADSTGV